MFSSYFRKLKSCIVIIIYIIQQGKKIKTENPEIKLLSVVFDVILRALRGIVRKTSTTGTRWEELGNSEYHVS